MIITVITVFLNWIQSGFHYVIFYVHKTSNHMMNFLFIFFSFLSACTFWTFLQKKDKTEDKSIHRNRNTWNKCYQKLILSSRHGNRAAYSGKIICFSSSLSPSSWPLTFAPLFLGSYTCAECCHRNSEVKSSRCERGAWSSSWRVFICIPEFIRSWGTYVLCGLGDSFLFRVIIVVN